MDYSRIYAAFITDRRTKETQARAGYSERHHILPRAKGGGDEPANLICLTPEDHFFAHLLLAKIYGGKMWQALMIMSRRSKGRDECPRFARRSRKYYGVAKREAASVYAQDFHKRQAEGRGPMQSAEARAKVSKALAGRVRTAEHSRKLSEAKKGRARSAESRAKQSATMTGMKRPPEFGIRVSAALKGLKKSPEHIEKMSTARRGVKFSDARREITRQASARRANKQPNLGNKHSAETKARMAAVYAAKRVYQTLYGVSPRVVTLAMIEAAGIPVGEQNG